MAKKTEKVPLKKGISQFTLVGKVKINENTFAIDNESSTSDYIYSRANIGVDTGNGVVFSSLMGGYFSTKDSVIYVHGTKKNDAGKSVDDFEKRFEIDWEDRFDDDILETVGDGCFIRVGIEKDSKGKTYVKKFLSAYDVIEYLSEHLENDMVVNITGDMQYQYYNDSVTVQKNIKSIFLSTKDEDEYKGEFRQTILVDVDSVGKLDKEKNTYPIECYVVDYVGKLDGKEVKQNVVMPKTLYFDVLDVENPDKTKKLLDKFFKPTKKNKMLEIGVIGSFCEGGVISTTTLDDLDEDVRLMLDAGMLTEEEALAKYTTGNVERRMVINQFITKNVSEDPEKKQLVIMKDEDKYTVDDLVFISQFVDDDDEDEYDEEETEVETNDETDDDENPDWLTELMNGN
jgi:hypothetical protein